MTVPLSHDGDTYDERNDEHYDNRVSSAESLSALQHFMRFNILTDDTFIIDESRLSMAAFINVSDNVARPSINLPGLILNSDVNSEYESLQSESGRKK